MAASAHAHLAAPFDEHLLQVHDIVLPGRSWVGGRVAADLLAADHFGLDTHMVAKGQLRAIAMAQVDDRRAFLPGTGEGIMVLQAGEQPFLAEQGQPTAPLVSSGMFFSFSANRVGSGK